MNGPGRPLWGSGPPERGRMPAMGTPLDYRTFGRKKLETVLTGLRLSHRLPAAERLFALLGATWRGHPVGHEPAWPSALSFDGTPFELSVSLPGAEPIIGIRTEARLAPFDLESNWKTGLALTRTLAELDGVSVERFERVAPLFAPKGGSASRMAIWHGGTVRPDGSLSFEVFLDAQSGGAELAPTRVSEALALLDVDYGCDELVPKLAPWSELRALSLELSAGADARVTVHVAHPHATATDVDLVVRDDSGYSPRLAQSWIEELTGSGEPLSAEPVMTRHSFRGALHAAEVTVEVPTAAYARSDAESLRRARYVLGCHATRVLSGVMAMAERPLDRRASVVRAMSLTPAAYGTRVALELAAEAHSTPRERRLHVSEPFLQQHGVVTGAA